MFVVLTHSAVPMSKNQSFGEASEKERNYLKPYSLEKKSTHTFLAQIHTLNTG